MLERKLEEKVGVTLMIAMLLGSVHAQEEQQPEGFIEGKVLQLIADLRVTDKEYSSDLVWIGESSLPLLTRAVDAEEVDLAFVTQGARTIFRIGGESLGDWITQVQEEYGALKKRAVIRGAYKLTRLHPKFADFARDPDPEVRLEALIRGTPLIPFPVRVALLEDGSATVRNRAWYYLRNSSDQVDDDYLGALTKLLVLCEEIPLDMDEHYIRQVLETFGGEDVIASSRGRETYLDSLLLPVRAIHGPYHAYFNSAQLVENEHLEQVLAIAQTLPPWDPEGGPTAAHQSLHSFIRFASSSWDVQSLTQVMELARLGYLPQTEWMKRCCTSETVSQFLPYLDSLHHTHSRLVIETLNETNLGSGFGDLRDWVRQHLVNQSDNNVKAFLPDAISVVAAVGSQESVQFMTELHAELIPACQGGNQKRYIDALKPDVEDDSNSLREAMRSLLSSDTCLAGSRSQAIEFLIEVGDDEAIPLFAGAYAHYHQIGVLGHLFSARLLNRGNDLSGGYDLDQWGAILKSCLENGNADAWQDVTRYLNRGSNNPLATELSAPILRHGIFVNDEVTRHVIGLISARVLTPESDEQMEEVLLPLLSHRDSQIRPKAYVALNAYSVPRERIVLTVTPLLQGPDAEVVKAAVRAIGSYGTPSSAESLYPMLEHGNSGVRTAAVSALTRLEPEALIDQLLPLIDDPIVPVRIQVILALQESLDQRAVPVLVEALRDPYVTKTAKAALEHIRYYHSEKAHWQRMQQGSTLTTETAAEALVAQAQDGPTKPVRLAAIQSLGTLAKPETLPILIELMQSEDQELAAAATAAINKINAK